LHAKILFLLFQYIDFHVIIYTSKAGYQSHHKVIFYTLMDKVDILISIALDLSSALNAESRYQRLLESLGRIIPYDAATLMQIEGDHLRVVAARGLSEDARGRRFLRREHPRLDIICHSKTPVRFAADSPIPDPFDHLLADETLSQRRIHSCLGCPLYAADVLIGALTADAVDPKAFDGLDLRFLEAIAALAGAEMQATNLIQALEASAEKLGMITRDLMRDAQMSRGSEMIGDSSVMERLRREIDLVARSDFAILVTGETGTGKELVARAIHAASHRNEQPILTVNCASLPESLAESELFGHVKGAFTGAVSERTGKFELADGGTLFLDEVGELPLSVQPKLLRVLQEGEVQKIGSDRVKRVDVRLIAATNRDLHREVVAGRFRADLFHRLNVYPLHVAPLRERSEDIATLAGHFCQQTQRRIGTGTARLAQEALEMLKRYLWPGNVRELENVISRAVLKASAEVSQGQPVTIAAHHLGLGLEFETSQPAAHRALESLVQNSLKPDLTLRAALDEFQKDYILKAVHKNSGNWAAAARQLGLHRSNLHKLAGRLGVK
jgi:anaerobic nitric oxide reductase transcription regulator